ncbi:hypothetical protein [Anaerotalea alkaliphila]|uniref:Uncharacterized protein n=1 Tax=Anaerotalea alkaliphila TaxID=2662126 RepID=A0A7X5HWY5_9FIRM|nr:hypothetical protein [Anaerotalea alkaliphila]NDL68199.1 hypothetical protein [Anaerotalea alkaliphila]
MYILGLIVFVVGSILFLGSRWMFRKQEKQFLQGRYGERDGSQEFLDLLARGMLTIKIVGAAMVVAGVLAMLLASLK